MPSSAVIYTIGHSNRSLSDFIALLQTHRIEGISDIRRMPRSRTHPQFNSENLEIELPTHGILYRQQPSLAGFRKKDKAAPKNAWTNPSFQAYANYMLTADFEQGLDELLSFAAGRNIAIMCSEAVWWRCHRRLVADGLLARGVAVRHILSAQAAKPHELTEMARLQEGKIVYPLEQA